jgi:hypothetical protein
MEHFDYMKGRAVVMVSRRDESHRNNANTYIEQGPYKFFDGSFNVEVLDCKDEDLRYANLLLVKRFGI